METFIYVLIGILSASFTFGVGYSVIGVVKGNKQLRGIEDSIFQLQLDLENLKRELHERIDMTEMRIDRDIEDIYKDFNSQLDSRLDKLENKLKSNFSDSDIDKIGYDLYKLKNKVDEFISTYQNQ